MNKKYLNISIGVLGLILVIAGTFLPPQLTQKLLFIFGVFLLIISSALEKHQFFAILETVVLVGSLVAFTSMSMATKVVIPIAFSILAIIYFATRGMLRDYVSIIGCIGLLFLATGFAISTPIVYFLGGLALTIYSYISYCRGASIALLFTILNAVFTVASAIAIF